MLIVNPLVPAYHTGSVCYMGLKFKKGISPSQNGYTEVQILDNRTSSVQMLLEFKCTFRVSFLSLCSGNIRVK